jgi:hypothetical protein
VRVFALLLTACSSASSPPDAPPASATLDECFADLTAPRNNRFIEVQTLRNQDGRIRLRRARTPGDGIAVGETFPYVLIRFAIADERGTRCVTDAAQLSYRYAHHNWNDSMEARAGDTIYRLEEKLTFDTASSTWVFTFTALDAATGAPREGPLPMSDAGCYTLPLDLNGCSQRMRMPPP